MCLSQPQLMRLWSMTNTPDSEEGQNSAVQSETDFGLNFNAALAVRPLPRIHFSLE